MAPNNQDFDSDIPVLEDLVMVDPPKRDWLKSDSAETQAIAAEVTAEDTLETLGDAPAVAAEAPVATEVQEEPAVIQEAPAAIQEEPAAIPASTASASAAFGTPAADDSMDPFHRTKPLPRDNPFLPYEHLEQLARERVEFQKQFAQFAVAQQSFRPQWSSQTSRDQTPRTGTSSNLLLDNLTRQLTQEVIQDLRPEIEQRVRRLLEQRFADWSDHK